MNAAPASLLFAALLVAVGPATAQDADGWDLTRTDSALMADVSYASGQSFTVRCREGRLDVMMGGLPVESGNSSRWLEWSGGGVNAQRQTWLNIPEAPLIFAARPIHAARLLRQGDEVSVRIMQTAVQPAQRYNLTLPSDPTALDQVLAACTVRLDDPRDAAAEIDAPFEQPGVFPNIWQQLPLPQYPSKAAGAGIESGSVLYNCVIGERGALRDCRIETETPANADFGKSTLQALRSARVRLGQGVEPGRLIVSLIRFRVE